MAADRPPRETTLRGVGIGWRPEIAGVVAELPELGFVEVVAENLSALLTDGPLPPTLTQLHARGVPAVAHGVSLSLGSADPGGLGDPTHLAQVALALGSPLVSEHLAFVRAGGIEAGHLLPCPRTREGVAVLVRNIERVLPELPVPLALELPAALLSWPEDELTDAQFVTEVLERANVGLLIDVANIYGNARNTGVDPAAELAAYPLERLAYAHIAGGMVVDGVYLDTHTHPVLPEVLELAALLAELAPGAPVLLERDGDYPPPQELAAELAAIRAAVGARHGGRA